MSNRNTNEQQDDDIKKSLSPAATKNGTYAVMNAKPSSATTPQSSPLNHVSSSSSSVVSTNYGSFIDRVRVGLVTRSIDWYLPPINIDGPFGGGHSEWSKFRTVILIGAGIGITPFASILQDFMHHVSVERLQEKEKERRRKKKKQNHLGTDMMTTYTTSASTSGNPIAASSTTNRKKSLHTNILSGTSSSNGASRSTNNDTNNNNGITKKTSSGHRVSIDPNATRQDGFANNSYLSARSNPSSAMSSGSSSTPPLKLYFVW